MGRLTPNVLLSFAQFEREVTAERIRDKVSASKRKGMWMGGAVPMGYDAKDKALVVNEAEADAIRTIYRDYVELKSVPALIRRLAERGIVSRRRIDRFGRVTGGAAYSTGALYILLRNPLYIGKVRHKAAVYDGQHEAIIDLATWQAAQDLLNGNGGGPIAVQRKHARRWLDGLFFDTNGWPMKTTYSLKALPSVAHGKKRYWYYMSRPNIDTGVEKGERLPAQPIETAVRTGLAASLADQSWLVGVLAEFELGTREVGNIVECAGNLAAKLLKAADDGAGPLLAPLVRRIDLVPGLLKAKVDFGALIDIPGDHQDLVTGLDIPFTLHQNGKARPIIVRTSIGEPHRDPELVALVADARRWRDDLLAGRAASIKELTDREGLPQGAISRVLPLAWLAPDISSAIVDGRQPSDLTLARLRDLRELPLSWVDQRALLGFPAI